MLRILRFSIVLTMAALAALPVGCSSREGTNDSAERPTRATKPKPGDKTVKENAKTYVVVIETSRGAIKAQLWADKAPDTVANFLRYVDEKFYDGLIFHRAIDGFMIQGGGFTSNMQQKPAHKPIRNEASADKPNDRGTLAMARTSDVHSATAQFFINLADNHFLNHKDDTPQGFGYCAFGKVIDGLDVVDRIGKVKTASRGHFDDVPVQPVEIISIRR